MSKIVVPYQLINGSYDILMKHVDWSRGQVFNLNFNHSQHYLETIYKTQHEKEVYLGDYYMVVRNGSKFTF